MLQWLPPAPPSIAWLLQATELSPIQPNIAASARARVALHQYFGHKSFRQHQLECCNRLLAKQDVMLVLATGGGKSVCYWLPMLMQDGFGIVVCPLKSLMRDQHQSLRKLGIHAVKVHPGVLTQREQQDGGISLNGAFGGNGLPDTQAGLHHT